MLRETNQFQSDRRLLVTGFEPFDGMKENLSGILVEHLRSIDFGRRMGIDMRFEILPVSYRLTDTRLADVLSAHQPDTVLAFGLGRSESLVTIERLAVNVDDADCCDNCGEVRRGSPIDPNGPAAYFSTLPVDEIQASLIAEGITATISNHAGAFLCNHLLYRLLHLAATAGALQAAGFFHLPRIQWTALAARDLERALIEITRCAAGIKSC